MIQIQSAIKIFRCKPLQSAFPIAAFPIAIGGVLAICAVLTAFASPGENRGHPDFSGVWQFDAKRSEFGPMPVPTRMTDSIEQSTLGMKIRRSMANDDQEATYEFGYKFDGSEVVNKTPNNQTRSRARWDSEGLVVDTNLEIEGLPLKIQDKWTLRPDCACLQISRHFRNQQGDLRLRIVMVRK